MPDTITSFTTDAPELQVRAVASFNTPLHLIDQIVDAMLPLIDRETFNVKGDIPAKVATLAPVIGQATVADAVLLFAMVDAADVFGGYTGLIESRRSTALDVLKHLLEDFIISAEASGPACVRARGRFARDRKDGHWNPTDAYLLIQSMGGDSFDAAHGTWDGDLFGGMQANRDSAFEPMPWWEHRQALLKDRHRPRTGTDNINVTDQHRSNDHGND